MNNVASLSFWLLVLARILIPPSLAAPAPADQAVASEAGFSEIEPIAFSFQNETSALSLRSSRVRLSYSFHPAERDPALKPLLVFFNGGPGCSTSEGLLSLNTAPTTLHQERTGGRFIRRNPYSWTEVGNLLYIDAPNTGFSYNLMRHGGSAKRRAAEFDAQNFNPFIDAAQFARFLLRFLAAHPALQANPVVLVGESYGGVRSTVLLNLLLFYRDYGDGGNIYRDTTLADEVEQHLTQVFPAETRRPFPPLTIARQFGRQVLIQPLLAGDYQDAIAGEFYEQQDSVIDRIAADTGKKFSRCAERPGDDCNPYENALRFVHRAGRDIYHHEQPARWFDHLGTFAERGLVHIDVLSRALRWNALDIPGLRPDARQHAYRYRKTPRDDIRDLHASPAFQRLPVAHRIRIEDAVRQPSSPEPPRWTTAGLPVPRRGGLTLVEALGDLNPWDDYLTGCNDAVNHAYYQNRAVAAGFDIAPTSVLYGELFLHNLAVVETFITHAEMDLVIYSPALPRALGKYSSLIEKVSMQDDLIIVTYRHGAFPDALTTHRRRIFFPHYPQAGHGVPASQPRRILHDVRDWLLFGPNAEDTD